MELRIVWMYHDIMDLYGDTGNIQVLKQRCLARDISVVVDTCGINEDCDLANYDLIFIGGGADKEQGLLYEDLLRRKHNIQKAIDENTFILLICGGYQLFGKYYLDAEGNRIEGLKFFDYYTVASTNKERCLGNVVIDFDGLKVVGFENHGGQTYDVSKPFGKVLVGHGNSYQSAYEGYYDGQVLGTYLHGPLLPKNSELADLIIKKSLSKRYKQVDLVPLDDSLELAAKNCIIERYLSK